VAHACNPSYSEGRGQEDCNSKPAQANSLKDPVSKIPTQKRAGRVAQGVSPEFKPGIAKTKIIQLISSKILMKILYP
jgi:hypothetical protein